MHRSAVPRASLPAAAALAPAGAVHRVTLQDAIEVARRNHADVAMAEESILTAQQRLREARVGTLPGVTGSVGYTGAGTSNLRGVFGNPSGPFAETRAFDRGPQPRVAINYTVWDGGLTGKQVQQAREAVRSGEASLAVVENDQRFSVTTNYIAQLRAERVLDLRREQENLAQEQLKEVEARISVGASAEVDRALPLSELRNRQVDRITAENAVRVSANTLRNSMGLEVGPPLELVELPANDEPPPPLEALRAAALRNRPEITLRDAAVREAAAGVDLARINRLPRVSTTLGSNINPNNPSRRSDWTLGAGISMPLWDGGLTDAREKEARTQVSSASYQLAQQRKDVASEVQEAYLNLDNARERVGASALAVDAAKQNLDATRTRYLLGARTEVVALIQAQVQYATASNSAIQALYDLHLARAQLAKSTAQP